MAIIIINPYQYAAPIGPSADPYSDYVSLLLHGNGTNNSTTFTDSSSYNHTVTANGDAKISTTQSKFGGASMYFDGNGDYLTLTNDASFVFGTGDFTVEMWVYHTSEDSQKLYYDGRPSSTTGAYVALYKTPQNKLALFVNAANRIVGTTSILQNTWYHIAVCRQGSSTKLFLNGTQEGSTFTDTTNYLNGTSRPIIGADGFNPSANTQMQGYIDDLRVTKGIARYTANFTPPTAELPDPSDPDFDSVSLLLHGDGNNGSTTFIDSSSNSHTVTPAGNAQISTAQSKFGGASMYFDGSGDYLEVPPSAGFDFDYGAFTVEAWIYLTANGTTAGGSTLWPIVNKHSIYNTQTSTGGSNTAWEFRYSPQAGNKLLLVNRIQASNFTEGTNLFTQYSTAVNLSLNTWYHVAAVRNGTTLKLFLNGQDVTDTTTTNYDWSTIDMSLDTGSIGQNKVRVGRILGGSNPGTVVWYAVGYIDDLRITKGVARYTSNFTPPTAPLAEGIPPIVTDGLVLHLDAGDSASYPGSGTTWTDLSGSGNNGTLTNGPTYDSSNGGSIVFDGDNDFVDLGTIGVSHPLQLNNGFTISWWGMQGGGGDLFQRIIDKSNGGLAANGWAIYPRGQTTPESQLTLNYNGTDGTINSSTNISSTSWQNWSLTWSSSSNQWIWYLNGSVDNSGYTTYNVPTVETNARIGSWNHSTAREYKGKISSVLIYTRPLTASEIARNYNALRDRYGL